MKTALAIIAGFFLLAGALFALAYRIHPTCFVQQDRQHSLAQTIADHRLPKQMTTYLHTNDVALVVEKAATEKDAPLLGEDSVWVKIVDREAEAKMSKWRKLASRVQSWCSFLEFDENGAYVLTKEKYAAGQDLKNGTYTYLFTLRLEADAKVVGSYIWEFPVYIDDRAPDAWRESYVVNSRKGEMVKVLQKAISDMEGGNGSKYTPTERGGVLTENMVKLTIEIKK